MLLLLFSIKGIAQEREPRFGIELGGGASFATKKIDDAKLKVGFGFEGMLHYRILSHFGVYAGWGWNKFSSANSFVGSNADFEETGYMFGLQFKHPIGSSPISFYLRGGGLYNHIEIESKNGDLVKDTKHGLGWQVAGGVNVPLKGKWSLNAGVRFNSLTRKNVDFESIKRDIALNYLGVRIGIQRLF